MERFILNQDIPVFYITASSFPEGIAASHEQLHARVPFSTERKYFGISRPEEWTGIVYKAAAEELTPGEGKKYQCESMVLKKGTYISETIQDYTKDLSSIGKTFDRLLNTPHIDPQGYCVEWYLNDKDVQCMVRLEEVQ